MKIRNSFVTNSSSSSFVLATSKELSEKQKDIILNYAIEHLLGTVIVTTKEELDKYYKSYYDIDTSQPDWRDYCWNSRYYDEELKQLKEGKVIRLGRIIFEESDWHLSCMYHKLWDELEKEDGFVGIDTDLSY